MEQLQPRWLQRNASVLKSQNEVDKLVYQTEGKVCALFLALRSVCASRCVGHCQLSEYATLKKLQRLIFVDENDSK